jgi:hypothetical protein
MEHPNTNLLKKYLRLMTVFYSPAKKKRRKQKKGKKLLGWR